MVHTGSDMLLYWKIKKHNDCATVVSKMCVHLCVYVRVCKLTRGKNEGSNTLFAYTKEHARMGVMKMQVFKAEIHKDTNTDH